MNNTQNTSQDNTRPRRWENFTRNFAVQPLPAWQRYGFAVLAVIIATLVKILLNLLFNPQNEASTPFLTFFLAIIVTAVFAGTRPALLVTFLAVLTANYFFTVPLFGFGFNTLNEFVNSVVFCLNGIAIALICSWLRNAIAQAQNEIRRRRVVQAQLEEQRENYLVTLSSIGDAVIATDEQGRITFINNIAESLTGWTQTAAYGQPLIQIFKIVNEQTRRPVENPVARVLTEGVIVGLANHTVLIARDGKEYPIADSAAPIRANNGKIVGVVLVFRNVSEQQAVERERERLLALEQKTRAETELANARISYLARASEVLAGSLDYATTLQNIANLAIPTIADWCSVSMPGPTLDSPIETVAMSHIDPNKIELVRQFLEQRPIYVSGPSGIPGVIRTGKPEIIPVITLEMIVNGVRDEEERQILLEVGLSSSMIVPMLADGQALGAIAFARSTHDHPFDNSDLAMAEELARRAAVAIQNARLYRTAQEAIAARDEFLSVAAHELKTPITGMRGFAQLLRRQLSRGDELDLARVNRALENIDNQSAKLTKLVERLLNVARLEAGKLVLELENTDVAALVRNVASTIQNTNEKHQLVINAPPQLLAVVDPIRFEQVVVNLLDNAVKYSPQGGRIEIDLTEPDDNHLRLSVRDYGIGIEPELRGRIFNRFFQAHERGYAGMGLGLYVSQQIVGLHSGTITAEFPHDGGTRFVITLPKITSQQTEE